MRKGKYYRCDRKGQTNIGSEKLERSAKDTVQRCLHISTKEKFLRQGDQQNLKNRSLPKIWKRRQMESFAPVYPDHPEMRTYKIWRKDNYGRKNKIPDTF